MSCQDMVTGQGSALLPWYKARHGTRVPLFSETLGVAVTRKHQAKTNHKFFVILKTFTTHRVVLCGMQAHPQAMIHKFFFKIFFQCNQWLTVQKTILEFFFT